MKTRMAIGALLVALLPCVAGAQSSPVVGNEAQPPSVATLPTCPNVADPPFKSVYLITGTKGVYDCVGGAWTLHGAGSGDFAGPGSSTSGNLVSFNGTSGKTGQDSGVPAANVVTAASNYANNRLIKAGGANKTTGSSLATDDGTTLPYTGAGGDSASSFTATGTPTQDICTEQAAPSTPTSGFSYWWCDSTAHDVEAMNSSAQKFAMTGTTETADIGYWFPSLSISAPTAQAVVTAGQQVRATQVFLPAKLKVSHITARISGTVAASTVTACLYSIDGNTKLIDSGTFDGNTASVQTKAITAVTLPSGWYWFAQTASTQTTLTAFTFPNDVTLNGFINNQTLKKQGTAANSASSGVCPSSLGAITGVTYTILATDFEP